LQERLESSIQSQFDLNTNKIEIFDQIDKFINEMVMRVELRREKLKNDYSLIETREKRRLKNKQIKLQKELDLLDEFKEDFDKFIDDFDLEMDYQANQASFENTYKQSYIEML
jgi:hypothetical protein